MLTHIDIDQEKIDEIMTLKGFKSKKEVVNKALEEYLRVLSARELLKMKGADVWEDDLAETKTV
jgi:Arc/MetJ family transcription regulator